MRYQKCGCREMRWGERESDDRMRLTFHQFNEVLSHLTPKCKKNAAKCTKIYKLFEWLMGMTSFPFLSDLNCYRKIVLRVMRHGTTKIAAPRVVHLNFIQKPKSRAIFKSWAEIPKMREPTHEIPLRLFVINSFCRV